MNFKPVVASLFALGLMSSPVMAAQHAQKHHKHTEHHGRQDHYGVKAEQRLSGEYSAQERFMNTSNAKSPVASFDWMSRIHFSGMINVDGKYSNRSPLAIAPGFHGHDYTSEFSVNNANLFVDVDVNHCVTGHIGLAYVADAVKLAAVGLNSSADFSDITDSVRADKGAVWANGRLGVDEAYITIRDFAQSPFYFRAGKMYVPYGDNHVIYPITESLSQLLTQTRATTVQAGWVSNYGLYASFFVLDGAQSSLRTDRNREEQGDGDADDFLSSYTRNNNYGAQLGFCGGYDDIRYHVSASYLKDIRDVEFLAAIQDLVQVTDNGLGEGFDFRRSAAYALHGDANLGPFSGTVNYTAALRNLVSDSEDHTRVAAGDLTGTYTTNVLGYNTGFSLGYQRSWEGSPILPKYRYQGDISVCVLPHTTLTVEYHYDQDYSSRRETLVTDLNENGVLNSTARQSEEGHHHCRHGLCATDRSSGTAAIRLGVVF
jgi:hypothetical protein